MRSKLLIALMFGFVAGLQANGDPTTRLSALERSANPAPRTITDIHVIREELRIKPGLYTEVSVRYFLWNASNKDYKDIDYAFPVDYRGIGEKLVNSGLIGDSYSESSDLLGWHDNYIKEIVFFANSVLLPFQVSPETIVSKPDKPLVQDPDEIETFGLWTKEEAEIATAFHTIGRKWFYTQFSINAGKTMILDVRYSLRNDATIAAYEGIERSWQGSSFYYDLSPAAHWGNGIARDMDIEIDISGVSNVQYKHQDEGYYHYKYTGDKLPLKFTEEEDKLVFRTRNFDFKNAGPVYFSYINPSLPSLEDWLPFRISNDSYTVTTSSENAAYPVSNLIDMNLQTAWAIPWKESEPTTITVKFQKPVRLGAILLLGGYHKSEKTFMENCRPGWIEVTAKVLSPEYVYNAETESYTFTGNYTENTDNYNSSSETDNNKYKEVTFNNLIAYSFLQQRFSWNESLVKEITINLLDIIPGTKYKDLCITELILLEDKVFLSNRVNE